MTTVTNIEGIDPESGIPTPDPTVCPYCATADNITHSWEIVAWTRVDLAREDDGTLSMDSGDHDMDWDEGCIDPREQRRHTEVIHCHTCGAEWWTIEDMDAEQWAMAAVHATTAGVVERVPPSRPYGSDTYRVRADLMERALAEPHVEVPSEVVRRLRTNLRRINAAHRRDARFAASWRHRERWAKGEPAAPSTTLVESEFRAAGVLA